MASIIGPLNFSSSEEAPKATAVGCLFCQQNYELENNKEKDEYLAHLFREHRLVIAEINEVSLLPEYLTFWRDKFQDKPIEEFCSTMLLDKRPDGTYSKDEKYFLLSDCVVEDRDIRLQLSQKRLEQVLARYQFERTDCEYHEDCLYCRDSVPPNRVAFLEHLYQKHFLQLGKPENLVFIDELIDVVKAKLEKFICLYCEKTFRDRPTLKEHMRKKGHKRINPDNKDYDKYYLCNYKKDLLDKSKKYASSAVASTHAKTDVPKDNEEESVFQSDSDSEWSDWEGEELAINCLFCDKSDRKFEEVLSHMDQEHGFDFNRHVADLNFYQKVKVVNYIRRQVHLSKCPNCGGQFDDPAALRGHLAAENHASFDVADQKWDQPEFFFPTYEDDSFLCFLDNEAFDGAGSESEADSGVVVLPEETRVCVNLEAERLSKEGFFE